jgi:hypothetical protein
MVMYLDKPKCKICDSEEVIGVFFNKQMFLTNIEFSLDREHSFEYGISTEIEHFVKVRTEFIMKGAVIGKIIGAESNSLEVYYLCSDCLSKFKELRESLALDTL